MARRKSKPRTPNAARASSEPRKSTPSRSPRRHGPAGLFAAALLVCVNLLIFGPVEIITSNRPEFDATLGDVLPGLIGISIAIAALLGLAGLLIPKRHRHRMTAILLAVGALCWIQGSFLKWGYGEFDGSGIDWSKFNWQGWVDLAIWLVVALAAVRFSRRLSRHALFLAAAFLSLQSAVMLIQTTTKPESVEAPDARAEKKSAATMVPELCDLSQANVFHLLMDGFQSDVFLELVEEEGLSEALDGFVVFPGNMSAGSQTILSVPSLFTGEVFDGSRTQSEYFQESVLKSFHRTLFGKGYQVNLMPHLTMDKRASANYFDVPAAYAAPLGERIVQASAYLIDISLFRQLPHFWKRVIYNDQSWRLSSLQGDPPSHVSFHQKAFFRDYIKGLRVKHTQPGYHFMHLMPPHGPFVTQSDGTYAGKALPNTRENYMHEARYILRLFMEFLDKLRALDLYDSSIIVLHGDHGIGLTADPNADRQEKRISNMSPLLLVKPSMAQGALKLSNAQTSLTDIPATVLGLLGIPHSYPGESVLDLDPDKTRPRLVVILTDKSAAEPLLNRWMVTGDVSDKASWQELEGIRIKKRVRAYKWGTRLRFGAANNGDIYLWSGWSSTSTNYAWNDGTSASIVFGVEKPQSDVNIFIEMFPYIVPGKLDRQRVHIRINGVSLGEAAFTDKQARAVRVTIPRAAFTSDRMVVTFDLPDATAPRDIDDGRESRALAIGLYAFQADLAGDG